MTGIARMVVLLTPACLLVVPIAAQGPPRAGLSVVPHSAATPAAYRFNSIPNSHWKDGAIAGGLFGLLVDGLFLNIASSCDTRNCGKSATIYLVPPLIFGGIGALIGSFVPKK